MVRPDWIGSIVKHLAAVFWAGQLDRGQKDKRAPEDVEDHYPTPDPHESETGRGSEENDSNKGRGG